MTREELERLGSEKNRLAAQLNAFATVNRNALGDHDRLNLDIAYRVAIKESCAADTAFAEAIDQYVLEHPVLLEEV